MLPLITDQLEAAAYRMLTDDCHHSLAATEWALRTLGLPDLMTQVRSLSAGHGMRTTRFTLREMSLGATPWQT